MRFASQILFRCLMISAWRHCRSFPLQVARPSRGQLRLRRCPGLAPSVVGEIAVVDEEKRFVLIDLDSNLYVPAPGAALRSTNAAGATAHLKASPEQKRPFIAADIVDGEPAVGDEVVR